MKTVYIVTVNGKVSQEAYKTLEEAQSFILSRVDLANISNRTGYMIAEKNGTVYEIHDVKVKA